MNQKTKPKIKIIFIGTSGFGTIVLKGIIENNHKPVLVITEPDKPVGRKHIITSPAVKILAQKHNIPTLQPEILENSKSEILNIKPDLVVVAAYGQILSKETLEIPKYGCLNVHPSLLPKYRGPSPIQHAILNGDKETGVSIMLLDKEMDHGPLLVNSKLQITDGINYPKLHDELAKIGTKLLVDIIPKWINGEIKAMPQDDDSAIYTKILQKENGKIDWKKSAQELERQIRAFYPWPGSFTKIDEDGKILKIWKAKIQIQDETCPRGPSGKTFMATNEEIAVQTGKDFFIIEELQLEGKNRMKAAEFLKGYPKFIGTILK
ncbi:methionyl-tRNA formyltransferase [Patescibacteria group bacterium]